MGTEEKAFILWCLERVLGDRGKLEAPFLSPVIRINTECDAYSFEPDKHLPLAGDIDQNQKVLYYWTDVTRRYTSARGPTRHTPKGRWKSTEGQKDIKINGAGATLFYQHFKYMRQGQNMKWAMIEFTLYPLYSKENKHALCCMYRTKQDGRQTNRGAKKKSTHSETNEGTSSSSSIQEEDLTICLSQEELAFLDFLDPLSNNTNH